LRVTVDIYVRLLTHDPGKFVAEILNDTTLDGLDPDRKAGAFKPDRRLHALEQKA